MRNKNKRQFTLIELIIVIVVIGILAGMALPKFIGVQRNAKVSAMETDLDVIEKAVLQYVTATDDGSYPFLDTNDDKTINENDLYFKTGNIPQTLTDSLLKASGDDGSKIYKLDMGKLEPYISKLKYPDTEYLYSENSDTAIDPIGKADGDNFIHHIIGSATNNDGVSSEKPITREVKQQIFNNLLFTNGDMIEVFEDSEDSQFLNNENSVTRKNVQRLYKKSAGFYLQDNKLKYSNYEVELSYPLSVNDEVRFFGKATSDSFSYSGIVIKSDGSIYFEKCNGYDEPFSKKLDITANTTDEISFDRSGIISITNDNTTTVYQIDIYTAECEEIMKFTYEDGLKDLAYYGLIGLSNKNEVYLMGQKTGYVVKGDNFFAADNSRYGEDNVFFLTTNNEVVALGVGEEPLEVTKIIGENDKIFSDGLSCVVLDSDGVFNLIYGDNEYSPYVEYYKINPTDKVFGDGSTTFVKKEDGTVDILTKTFYNVFNVLDDIPEDELNDYPEEILNEFKKLKKCKEFKNPLISSESGQNFIIYGNEILYINTIIFE